MSLPGGAWRLLWVCDRHPEDRSATRRMDRRHTYIQKTGIDHDFGVFDSPDAFYEKHGANLSGLRRLLFVWMVRHMMNATIG